MIGAHFDAEAGAGWAAFGGADAYAAFTPRITLHAPSRRWHLGEMLFGKRGLHRKLRA